MQHASPDNIAYLYDGSVEGLLTAVFKTYEHKEHPVDLCPATQHQPRLGQEIRIIETNIELALRVQRGICRTAGYSVFNVIKTAALADEPSTGISVYHFIRYCMDKRNAADFHQNKKGEALLKSKLTGAGCGPALLNGSAAPAILHPSVEPVLKLERFVQNERHHIIQFLRFEELSGGLWCARCNPKASIVPLIVDWFAARFNIQPLSSTMRITIWRAFMKEKIGTWSRPIRSLLRLRARTNWPCKKRGSVSTIRSASKHAITPSFDVNSCRSASGRTSPR